MRTVVALMSSACHWGSTAVRGGEVDGAVVLGERGFDRGIDATTQRRRRLGALRPRLVIVRRVDDVPAPPHRTEHVGAVLGAMASRTPCGVSRRRGSLAATARCRNDDPNVLNIDNGDTVAALRRTSAARACSG